MTHLALKENKAILCVTKVQCFITCFRLLTSGQLQEKADDYIHFLDGNYVSMKDFCDKVLALLGMEPFLNPAPSNFRVSNAARNTNTTSCLTSFLMKL